MSAITAIYQDGVFRPTSPVALPDGCAVDLEFRARQVDDSGAGRPADWEAAALAARQLQQTGYDFEAWRQQREFDATHAHVQAK